jgi:hypothetical protein
MKKLIIPLFLIVTLSSCIIEVDMTPSYVEIGNIDEYETKEVIKEVWSGGQLIYEEFIYHTFLEIEFINTGGMSASNVWAEIYFYNGPHTIRTTTINLPTLYAGDRYIYELNTGFDSLNEYTDYEVSVHWD